MTKAEIVKEFASKLPDELPEGFEYGPVQTVNHPGEYSIYSVRTRAVPPVPKPRQHPAPVEAAPVEAAPVEAAPVENPVE